MNEDTTELGIIKRASYGLNAATDELGLSLTILVLACKFDEFLPQERTRILLTQAACRDITLLPGVAVEVSRRAGIWSVVRTLPE